MLARPRLNLLRISYPIVATLVSLALAACGGDQKITPQPDAGPQSINGSYAQVFGTHTSTFTMDATKAHVTCLPKPGLKEFYYEATLDTGEFFRFTLVNYTGPNKDYRIDYAPAAVQNKVEVGFPAQTDTAKTYRYKFFQFQRTDINTNYPSHCDVSIKSEGLTDRIKYTGIVSCGALWADTASPDYHAQPLNGFADLVAKFECEQEV
jgi:hypothetical protein